MKGEHFRDLQSIFLAEPDVGEEGAMVNAADGEADLVEALGTEIG